MKSRIFTLITAITLFTALAMPIRPAAQEKSTAQEHRTDVRYTVTDLGPVGSYVYYPFLIANDGLAAGSAANPDGTVHALLWYKGSIIDDLGTPGLGGPNTAGFSVNERGQAVGQAETSVANDEDFCGFNANGFSSLTQCLPFVWQNGVMTALPTLGGANGFAYSINNRGEVAGLAETKDSGCPVTSHFEPVIWKNGVPRPLPPYTGDTDGVAAFINDHGQVAGASGTCAPLDPDTGLYLVEYHAVLWDSNGTPHDLGNLGGTGGLPGNHACALNNRGQVVGHSELNNDLNPPFHAFLWTKETDMQDLGTLPGDFYSLALGINDRGDVVGQSGDAAFTVNNAVLWERGASMPVNLNTLVIENPSGLSLVLAESINLSGEIVGLAMTSSMEPHGYLATPVHKRSR
jgi:probable HAF family extracellular repeat protein